MPELLAVPCATLPCHLLRATWLWAAEGVVSFYSGDPGLVSRGRLVPGPLDARTNERRILGGEPRSS